MSKKNEKKQIAQMWFLVILIVALIAVITNIILKVTRIKKQEVLVAQQYKVQLQNN